MLQDPDPAKGYVWERAPSPGDRELAVPQGIVQHESGSRTEERASQRKRPEPGSCLGRRAIYDDQVNCSAAEDLIKMLGKHIAGGQRTLNSQLANRCLNHDS